MQKILKAFLAVPWNHAKYNELCEQILVNNGQLMQVSLQMDDLTDSLVQVRNVYQSDLRSQLSDLHDLIDSHPNDNEESKGGDTGSAGLQDLPLMVIAEDNKLNWIDQSMQYLMK